jgi:hypothetical protein
MLRAIVVFALALFSIASTAQTLDFADVDSLGKVQALASGGKLEKVYLFPLALGGQDIPQNIAYVPPVIAGAKRKIDGTIERMFKEGSVTQYKTDLEYKGKSFVPSKIKIKTWHPERSGEVSHTIEVW